MLNDSTDENRSYKTIQTVLLTAFVLTSVFGCMLTVALSNKWHMDVMVDQLDSVVDRLVRETRVTYEAVSEIKERWAKNVIGTDDGFTRTIKRRRDTEIDVAVEWENELNCTINGKSLKELQSEAEEVVAKEYNRRGSKRIDHQVVPDWKFPAETMAARFPRDTSKYDKAHDKPSHPDGGFKDWTFPFGKEENVFYGNHLLLQKNGNVSILTAGVYFVYAQIFYPKEHDIHGFYIMKNGIKELACSSTRHGDNQLDSCYTGGLIYFNSNDLLSIKGLDNKEFMHLDSENTFYGLFKV